jgi:hypothetical protein
MVRSGGSTQQMSGTMNCSGWIGAPRLLVHGVKEARRESPQRRGRPKWATANPRPQLAGRTVQPCDVSGNPRRSTLPSYGVALYAGQGSGYQRKQAPDSGACGADAQRWFTLCSIDQALRCSNGTGKHSNHSCSREGFAQCSHCADTSSSNIARRRQPYSAAAVPGEPMRHRQPRPAGPSWLAAALPMTS